ncbi:unnamed protein product [Lactuca saligna]|uniref:DUF4378 domain-containing protein n=1 Tax=Lactuca saligna TaxID=75948 RepID=A0AA35VFG2_LACSI|nr:unnamed protein product [Lactuca saligna]
MATKEVVYALKDDDKQELQKQLGCMNGIFQLFDRRYLLGQRRRHNQKRLPPPSGQSGNDDKDFSKPSEQTKEKNSKVAMKEKQRVSVELPRNSVSSSTSSNALSSLDCCKRVQTEQSSSCQSVVSEPSSSPFLTRKQPDFSIQSPDIRDVVRDSMTREPRVVSIKAMVGPPMKHIDSPRPFPHKKTSQSDENGRNLREIPWSPKEVKETTRRSCDGRESRYSLKSNMKIKELPRLSLDSRQSCISNSAIDARRSLLGDMESAARTNKRPSSGVVARLMGLESLTAATDESATLKTPCLSQESVSKSKSRKEEELKRGVGHVITRIPLETAPWKQEGSNRGAQKPPFKSKEDPEKSAPASPSIYGAIEKRLTEHDFKSSGKDLRALKQILEAMQKTRRRLEYKDHALDNNSTIDDHKPVSPTIKGISPPRKHEFLKVDIKPATLTSDSSSIGRGRLKDSIRRDKKSTSNFPDYISTSSRYSGPPGPRIQRSKNGVDKPLLHGPSSELSRTRKQPGMQVGSRTRKPKAKSMDTLQETRTFSQQSDTVSFRSESNSLASQSDSEVMSTEWMQEVNSPFRPKENHRGNIAERLTEEKSMVDHAKHTMEQPSPVSVLDAFYTEDPPSPVKKKSNSFNDDENLHFEEAQYSEFSSMKLENIKNLVHQIELLNTKPDDASVNHTPCEGEIRDERYVREIIIASGFLKDLVRITTIVQIHPTGGLINPELFHVLEKTKGCTDFNHKSKSKDKIRRKMVFDSVNDVLGHKLGMLGPFGPKGRILNEDKLLKEVCSEIDSLQNKSKRGVYDEDDDEVINIINADVNKRSQDWEEYCYEVPGLVLDIERLIFKDLVSEVVNAQVNSVQDWSVRHRRQLFPM